MKKYCALETDCEWRDLGVDWSCRLPVGETRAVPVLRRIFLLAAVFLAFRLQAAPGDVVKFSGTVVDSNGKPVSDAWVDCYSFPYGRNLAEVPEMESKQHATTGGNGRFEFSVPSGAATVVVKKAGFASGWKTWQSVEAGDGGSLTLAAPSSLAGTVVDENDRPVASAEVSVSAAVDRVDAAWSTRPNFLFGEAAKDLFTTRTSSDGHFRIINFPSGAQANLAVKAPGKVLKISTARTEGNQLQAQAGQDNIKLVTQPAGSIEGVVVTKDGGTPLAGAGIQLQPANNGAFVATSQSPSYSDSRGVFRVSDVAAGSYRLIARFTNQPVASWVADPVPVTVTAGQTSRDVKIEAIKGGVVEVTVSMKGDSKGVAGVNVSAYSEGYPANGITASDGRLFLRLPPGQFTIYGTKPGLSQAQVQSMVGDGETNRVKLELPLPSKMAGTLRDSSGSPVAGATVNVYPNFGGGDEQETKSGAAGHYEVTWQKPSWAGMQDQRFYLLARDEGRNLAAVQEIDESAGKLDVEMKPAMSISARVQDAQGKAITNASGYVMLQMVNNSFPITRQAPRVDQDGVLRVEALPRGERYYVSFFAAGYGNGQQNMSSTADPKADHYDFPAAVLKLADRKLAGRVLGLDGKPLAGVQVWIQGTGQPNGNATTDSDGHFSFDAVCEGPITVSANGRGGNGMTQAKGGDTSVTVRMGSNVFPGMNPLTVSGTVYDANGAPAPEVRVSVAPSWGPDNSAMTDEKGTYTLGWQMQQGMRGVKYYVVARDPRKNLAGMAEINDKTTDAPVHMEEGFTISGTVQDADGNPFTRANVNLNMMTGNAGAMVTREPIRIESDGTFTIPALPKGQQYWVNVSAMDHGSSQKTVTKNQSQSNSIELPAFRLRNADQDLAGQVVGPDGKPMANVQVYTYGNNQPNVNMQTDSDGRFKMKVCSGPINVQAYSQVPIANGMNFANVQARGGDKNVMVKLGQQQQRRAAQVAALVLKPRPWSLSAFVAWPAGHKTAAIILGGLQASVLIGAGAVVFFVTRKRKV